MDLMQAAAIEVGIGAELDIQFFTMVYLVQSQRAGELVVIIQIGTGC